MTVSAKTVFYRIVLLAYFAAVCIALPLFSNFYHHEDADSLIYSIMSYTHLTLFDWGQDRLLSFAPFMVSFIKNPSWNLAAMSAMFLTMTFSLPFLTALIFDIKHPVLYGFLAIAFLLPFNSYFWFEQCVVPYSEAFFLICLAMLAAKRMFQTDAPRAAAGWSLLSAFLLLLSYEVAQPSLAIYVVWCLFLFVGKIGVSITGDSVSVRLDRLKAGARTLGMLVVFYALACAIFGVVQYGANQSLAIINTPMDVTLLLPRTMNGVMRSVLNMVHFYVGSAVGLTLTFWGCITMIVYLAVRREFDVLRKAFFLFALPAAVIALALCSMVFVRVNGYHQRYLCDPILLCDYGSAFLLVSILDRWPAWIGYKRVVVAALAALCAIAVFVDFGPRPFETPSQRIAEIVQYPDELKSIRGADGIIGNYWRIWPVVWLENAWGRRGFLGIGQRTGYNFNRLLDSAQQEKGLTLVAYSDDKSASLCMRVCLMMASAPERVEGPLTVIQIGPFKYQPSEQQIRVLESAGP